MRNEDISVLISEILVELNRLKAERLRSIHMQDFNVDVIRKETKDKTQTDNAPGTGKKYTYNPLNKLTVANDSLLNYIYKDKSVLSKFSLKRRAKKVYKLQKNIENGYISAVDKCIKIVEKAFNAYMEGN